MCKKCCCISREVPVSELRQQLDYARTISSDLFKLFSSSIPDVTEFLDEYTAVQSKLSMLLDFLFQAKLWCDTMEPAKHEDPEEDEE